MRYKDKQLLAARKPWNQLLYKIEGARNPISALIVDSDLPITNMGSDLYMTCNLLRQWQEAMRQECVSLMNNIFPPVSKANSQPIGSKWVT